MYRGKYQWAKRSKSSRVILIASLVLLLAVAVGGTVALLKGMSDRVTNTFTPGVVKITPTESVTDTQKSDIRFQNTGTTDVYIRATLVIRWTDTFDLTDDGVDNPTEQIIAEPAGASVAVGELLDNGWFRAGDIYYYAEAVAPGKQTEVMLRPITVTLPDGSTAQCHIDVRAEAIQAEPADAVEAAWKDVNVVGGKLEQAN